MADAEALVTAGRARARVFTPAELADLLAPIGPPIPSVADAAAFLLGPEPVDVRALPRLRAPEDTHPEGQP